MTIWRFALCQLTLLAATASPSQAYHLPSSARLDVQRTGWNLSLTWNRNPEFPEGTAVEFEIWIQNGNDAVQKCFAQPVGGKDSTTDADTTFPAAVEPYKDVWNYYWPESIGEVERALQTCGLEGSAASLCVQPCDFSNHDKASFAVGIREAANLQAGTYTIRYDTEIPTDERCFHADAEIAVAAVRMELISNECTFIFPDSSCANGPDIYDDCLQSALPQTVDCPYFLGFDLCFEQLQNGEVSHWLLPDVQVPVSSLCWAPDRTTDDDVAEIECPGAEPGNFPVAEFRDGALLKDSASGNVFYVRHDRKLLVVARDNYLDFDNLGLQRNKIRVASDRELATLSNGPTITGEGSLFHGAGATRNAIYRVEVDGRARPYSGRWDDDGGTSPTDEFQIESGFPKESVFDATTDAFMRTYVPHPEREGYWPPITPPTPAVPSDDDEPTLSPVRFAWNSNDNDAHRFGFEVCPDENGRCAFGDLQKCQFRAPHSGARNEVLQAGVMTDTIQLAEGNWCWKPWALGNDIAMEPTRLTWVEGRAIHFAVGGGGNGMVAGLRCPGDCSEHGDCDSRSGTCACDRGYDGASCNHCEEDFDGYPNCEPLEVDACPEGEQCNDDRDETENDHCVAGECQGTPVDDSCERPCDDIGSYVPNDIGSYCYRCLVGGCLEEQGQRVPDAGVCTEYRCTGDGVREVPLPNDLRFLCDDHDPATDPDICVDGECRGESVQVQCVDNDGDGFGENCARGVDCDDSNPDYHPGAFDECENGVDEDCNDMDRDCPPVLCDPNTWSPDPEGNTCRRCGPDGSAYLEDAEIDDGRFCTQDDCNAASGVRNLALPMNGRGCDDGQALTLNDSCSNGLCVGRACADQDQDGAFADCAPFDCDDRNLNRHPGAAELCNQLDDDCNGQTDEGGVCPAQACIPNQYYPVSGFCRRCLADGSGFVDNGTQIDDGEQCTSNQCNGASGIAHPNVSNGTLCDDNDANTSPDVCQDGQCMGANRCIDSDGDGFSANCAPTDCDDGDPAVNPGEVEQCDNGVDEDCNLANDACQCPDGTCAIRVESVRQVVLVDITRFHLNDGTPLPLLESQGELCYRGFARGEPFHDLDYEVRDDDDGNHDGWIEVPIPNLAVGAAPYPGCRTCNVQALPYRWVLRRCYSDAAVGGNNTNLDDWRLTGAFYWHGWDDNCDEAWTLAVSRNAGGYYASGGSTSFGACAQ